MYLRHTHIIDSEVGIKLELWEDNNGRWHWVLKSMSWEIARSRIEGYANQGNAERSIWNGVFNACLKARDYFFQDKDAPEPEVEGETTVVETLPSMMKRQAD